MLKKLLVSSILTASVLSIATAYAANPSNSLTVNSNDLSPLNVSSHFYIGGQLGYANTHIPNKVTNEPEDPDFTFNVSQLSNNSLASRIYAGYAFNSYLAVELGYLQLANVNKTEMVYGYNYPIDNKLSQHAFDMLAKASMPIAHNFSVYGKLGVAYLTTALSMTTTSNIVGLPFSVNLNHQLKIAKHQWAPEAAVGINYKITPNMSVDTSWTHIQPLGNNRTGNIDFVAVGLGYQFG